MPPAKNARSAARSDAERAALQLLQERVSLVGEASAARHRRDQIAEELRVADVAYAELHAACRTAGWTEQELRDLGLPAPGEDGGRRRPDRVRRGQAVLPPASAQPLDQGEGR